MRLLDITNTGMGRGCWLRAGKVALLFELRDIFDVG
jgi:hypothetical protein